MKSCANTHILQIKNFSMISFWAKLRKLLYFHVANVMQGVFSWKRVFSWKTNFGPPESGSSANPSSREHFMSYQWEKSSRSEGCSWNTWLCRAEFEEIFADLSRNLHDVTYSMRIAHEIWISVYFSTWIYIPAEWESKVHWSNLNCMVLSDNTTHTHASYFLDVINIF